MRYIPGNGTSMSAWSISMSCAVFDPGAAHMSRICTEIHAHLHFKTISFSKDSLFSSQWERVLQEDTRDDKIIDRKCIKH